MQALKRIARKTELHRLSSTIAKTQFISAANVRTFSSNSKKAGGDDDWNDAWETAWLPPDLSGNNSRAPWETDVNFSSPGSSIVLPSDADHDTKAFVEDMNENWNERRKPKEERKQNQQSESGSSLYSLESLKKDYRVKKQRIHAGLWMKEIEKQEEAKLADSNSIGGGDDIERLLDSCSDIFDSPNNDLGNSNAPSASDYKNKPDGWETTSKAQEGNIWEMTQREEDILLQEFERRIAYNKFQIASFIKTHIFSRRRPIDGWKYMIEELGPNARKGKGSVSRLPSLSDASTQPFKEEKTPMSSGSLSPYKESSKQFKRCRRRASAAWLMTLIAKSSRLGQRLTLSPTHNSVFFQDLSLISLLPSCKTVSEISQIHGSMVKTGLDHLPFPSSKLLASSIQDIQYAAAIFNRIQNPNLFMFNTMLRAYSISDDPKHAFHIFNNLRAQNITLDQFSFVATIKACARESAIGTGRGIHGVVVRSGFGPFVNVKNTLLQFYCSSGKIEDARKVFDEFPQRNDLVSLNTLMGGYLHASKPHVVVDLFKQMCRIGFEATVTTVLNLLSAIGGLESHLGEECIHGYCIKIGFCSDLHVLTALIDAYAKKGEIDLGRRIFNGVSVKDVVLWNCLVDKHARCGMVEEAVALLRLMKLEGMKPNSSTLAGLLSVCAASGSVSVGSCIKDYVEDENLVLDAVLGTALVDMYAKCGFLDKALDIFESMESKDVKSWTAMISGYGVHGQAGNAIRLFDRMEEEGCQPNEVTFLAVLSACSHGGLVAEGVRCFEMMVCKYGFVPKVEHYGCMVDLLGRAGLLEEAHKLIESLPVKTDVTAWRALLSACRVYGYVALGESVQKVLLELNDDHPTNSMLLSGTYAIAGRLPDHITRRQEIEDENMAGEVKFRPVRIEDNLIKEAGLSSIEMDS
ncbi:hypothetical protein ACFX2I_011331 [Malus domestica]